MNTCKVCKVKENQEAACFKEESRSHDPEGKGTILEFLAPAKAYDIPLRCVIPLKAQSVLEEKPHVKSISEKSVRDFYGGAPTL